MSLGPRESGRSAPFHPSQLVNALMEQTIPLPRASAEALMGRIPLQMFIYPTAVLQEVAIEREWSPTASLHKLLDDGAKRLDPKVSRSRMLRFVGTVDDQTYALLRRAEKENGIFGYSRLPTLRIPVVFPLLSDPWTSIQSIDRLNLVRGVTRLVQNESDSGRTSAALDNFFDVQAQYLNEVQRDLKATTSRLTDLASRQPAEFFTRSKSVKSKSGDQLIVDFEELKYQRSLDMLDEMRALALDDGLTTIVDWANAYAAKEVPQLKQHHLIEFKILRSLDGKFRAKPSLGRLDKIAPYLAKSLWDYVHASEKGDDIQIAQQKLETAIMTTVVDADILKNLLSLALPKLILRTR